MSCYLCYDFYSVSVVAFSGLLKACFIVGGTLFRISDKYLHSIHKLL